MVEFSSKSESDDEPLRAADLLTELLLFLGCDPAHIDIEEQEDDSTVSLMIHVAQKDVGIVIGHNGERIQAIRRFIGAGLSLRKQKRVKLDVSNPKRARAA